MSEIDTHSAPSDSTTGATTGPAASSASPWVAPVPAEEAAERANGSRSGHELWVNVWIPLGLLALAGLIVLLLGSVEPEKRPDPDMSRSGRLRALPPVEVISLQSLAETGKRLELEVDGTVVPFQEARVAAEVAGRVIFKSEQCEAGSYVEQGDLLMKIDPTDYKLEVQRLERQLEQEKQAIQEIDQEIRNTKRLVDVAEQDVQLQQQEVDRLQSLPKDFASRAEIDRANRTLLAAKQQLVTVENQYDLLQRRRVRLQASVRLAETQLEAANVNLERTEIAAPIEGVIVSEQADLNTFVARGATLVTIENTSKVEVATNLRMDQLQWILDQRGETVDPTVRGYDLPETPAIIQYEVGGRDGMVYRWQGRLLSYDGIGLDPVTRTVPVRVVVDQPRQNVNAAGEPLKLQSAPALVRGMFVRVKLLLQPSQSLLVIPARALQPGNRVFQFVPDESVLAKSESAEEGSSSSQAAAASERVAPPQAQTRQKDAQREDDGQEQNKGDETDVDFIAERWVPGRVVVRDSIYPIDSMQVTSESDSQLPPDLEPANRLWVCEAAGGKLGNDAFVVVSPLGDVDRDEGLPARASRADLATDVAKEDSSSVESVTESSTGVDSAQQQSAATVDAFAGEGA